MNVPAGTTTGIAIEEVCEVIDRPYEAVASDKLLEAIEIQGEGFKKGRKIRRIPFAGDKPLTKADIGRRQDATHEPEIVDDEDAVGTGFAAFNADIAAGRQDKCQ